MNTMRRLFSTEGIFIYQEERKKIRTRVEIIPNLDRFPLSIVLDPRTDMRIEFIFVGIKT